MSSRVKVAKRLLACAAALVVIAFGPAISVQAQELETINVMTSNDASCSPYPQIASDEFGFFADAGIKINLLSSSTSIPFVAFLSNGDADIVMLDPGQVLQAVNAEQPISVLYEAYQGASDGIVVPADSDIKTVADLKGKTIGMASDRDQLTTIIALSTVGMKISEVETVVVGESGPVVALALQNDDIQAYAAANSEFAALASAGITFRNITPVEVSQVPGNSWTVWTPTLEEKRPLFEKFLRAWAMGQHSGIMDTKAVMAACQKRIPEQWEDPANGERVVNNSVHNTQIRRTVKYGELQRDVWEGVQQPYVDFGEIDKTIDIDTFLDPSFIDAANSFTTDEVKAGVKAWKEANM
jgi:NitT/TauT family transport system substrate-binding protein